MVGSRASSRDVWRPTAVRRPDRWSEAGSGGFDPVFDGRRPPDLTDDHRERLEPVCEADHPWTNHVGNQLVKDVLDMG